MEGGSGSSESSGFLGSPDVDPLVVEAANGKGMGTNASLAPCKPEDLTSNIDTEEGEGCNPSAGFYLGDNCDNEDNCSEQMQETLPSQRDEVHENCYPQEKGELVVLI